MQAIKTLLLTLIAIVALASPAKADAFYSGVYVGMSIKDAFAYYFSGKPPIAASYMTWGTGHTLPGQKLIDFRTKKQERRVEVTYRASDGIIVAVGYYNIGGEHFENADLKKLLDLQQKHTGQSHLVGHLYGSYGNEDFVVTTHEQYKLEQEQEQEDAQASEDRAQKATPANPPAVFDP